MRFLIDIIPIKARRYVYGVAAFALAVLAAWKTADHDWPTAIVLLLAGIAPTTLAHANTVPPDSQKGNADEWQ